MGDLCIDLYAGAGGATLGLRDAGFDVIAAVENDKWAADTYARNHPDVVLAHDDIREIDAHRLRRFLGLARGELSLLKACPPCQGFSSLANGSIDERRNDLVLDVIRFVVEFRPVALMLENVPGLRTDRRLGIVGECLTSLGYTYRHYLVDATQFGVPQRRKRLIFIALRDVSSDSLPASILDLLPDDFDRTPKVVADALAALSRESFANDPMDRYRQSRPEVKARIAAVPIGGSRFALPESLQLQCHRNLDSKGGGAAATASYGRIRLDAPAPTMTTRCTTPACGSFIHPTLNRGLTLREAATFQTFPGRYEFSGGYDSIERQIGNAVPVKMATGLGLAVRHLVGGSAVSPPSPSGG